jgi:nitrite reductase/ring-hydroxylating ferredoxin subunit
MRLPSPRALLQGRSPLDVLPQPGPQHLSPTWREAAPHRIAAALEQATQRDPGGWCVVGASRDLSNHTSTTRRVDGLEIVLWRDRDGSLQAGPGACPHMGALLDNCPVINGAVRCRWHGMALGPRGDTRWTGYPALDDGVLLWVRRPLPGEDLRDCPRLPARPPLFGSIAAVVQREGLCEPRDIIANRLDPWHGAWFHPYAFSHLTVDDTASDADTLAVDVAYRLGRRIGIAVRAEFTCPDARTIVMTIVAGEGSGSVVETHATPLGPGPDGLPRTMVTEATIAHSERTGFRVARLFAPVVRAGLKRSAERLWIDDLMYAERTFTIRRRSRCDPAP